MMLLYGTDSTRLLYCVVVCSCQHKYRFERRQEVYWLAQCLSACQGFFMQTYFSYWVRTLCHFIWCL